MTTIKPDVPQINWREQFLPDDCLISHFSRGLLKGLTVVEYSDQTDITGIMGSDPHHAYDVRMMGLDDFG